MQTNDRLQRVLRVRQLGSGAAAGACAVEGASSTLLGDAKLFAMTFAAGFLFTIVFLA
jgi:hypothetical protein